MMNVTISSAVSIELFNDLQATARERKVTLSELIRIALNDLLDADKTKDRKEKGKCKKRPELKVAL